MSEDTNSVSQGNVEINVEKYTQMVLKLDEANDKIREMDKLSKELQIATAAAKPKEKFSFGALFRDENDINEKSIIGFASFIMMLAFGIVDLVTVSIWYSRLGNRFLGNGFKDFRYHLYIICCGLSR